MANVVFGPFGAISITQGVTSINKTWGDNAQTQASVALHGFNSDHIGAGFVYSGCAVTGTVGTTTVNIASGVVYVVMTDGTVGRITVGSATQTTAALSSTYHLYVQPDGTFYWSTSNSPAANSVALANVLTNGSGQISSITDQRSFNFSLFSGAAGKVTLPTLNTLTVSSPSSATINGATFDASGNLTSGGTVKAGVFIGNAAGDIFILPQVSGAAGRVVIDTWDGAAQKTPLVIGGSASGSQTQIKNDGSFGQIAAIATAGSFGVPLTVAQVIDSTVAVNTQTSVLTYTTPNDGINHMFQVTPYYFVGAGNTNNGTVTLQITWTDAHSGAGTGLFQSYINGTAISALAVTKGTNGRVAATHVECSPNTSIIIKYTNSAAGTISDLVSGVITLLN